MKKLIFLYITLSLSAQKTIIVDLTTVFLKENMLEFIKQTGFKKLATYTMYHFKNPADGCLDFLDRISKEPEERSEKIMRYRNRTMPKCMVDWQLGNISYKQLVSKLKYHNQNLFTKGYFSRVQDKELVDELMTVALNPAHAHEIIKITPGSANLAREMKQQNCSLYGVANMASETFNALKKTYPDFFASFDDIIISSHTKTILPEHEMFNMIIKKHHLEKEHCLYIEGNKEYAKEAQKTGLKTGICSNARSMRMHLKKSGFLG